MSTMLSGQVDFVVGVDTHRDTNVAAIVEAVTGGVVDHLHCATDAMGYKRGPRLRHFARTRPAGLGDRRHR